MVQNAGDSASKSYVQRMQEISRFIKNGFSNDDQVPKVKPWGAIVYAFFEKSSLGKDVYDNKLQAASNARKVSLTFGALTTGLTAIALVTAPPIAIGIIAIGGGLSGLMEKMRANNLELTKSIDQNKGLAKETILAGKQILIDAANSYALNPSVQRQEELAACREIFSGIFGPENGFAPAFSKDGGFGLNVVKSRQTKESQEINSLIADVKLIEETSPGQMKKLYKPAPELAVNVDPSKGLALGNTPVSLDAVGPELPAPVYSQLPVRQMGR